MQHDPVRIADTSSWLEKATTDIRSAKADLDVTPPILTDALFHCQQAVEKALKAFLTWPRSAVPPDARLGGTRHGMRRSRLRVGGTVTLRRPIDRVRMEIPLSG